MREGSFFFGFVGQRSSRRTGMDHKLRFPLGGRLFDSTQRCIFARRGLEQYVTLENRTCVPSVSEDFQCSRILSFFPPFLFSFLLFFLPCAPFSFGLHSAHRPFPFTSLRSTVSSFLSTLHYGETHLVYIFAKKS